MSRTLAAGVEPRGSRMTRRQMLRVAVVGLAAGSGVTILAPTQALAQATSQPAGQGTLTVGLAGASFASMDNIHGANTISQPVYEALFNELVRIDFFNQGAVMPMLAESWKQIDPLTWDFSIRQGVTFHNGEPLDADGAAFSLQLVLDGPSWLQARTSNVDSVMATDTMTLRIVTKKPDVQAAANLSEIPIFPKNYYTSVGPETFARQPIGTGQFKFESWEEGVQLKLSRFDQFWDQKAAFDKVTFKPIAEPSTRLSSLLAGELDIATVLSPDNAQTLKDKGFQAMPVGVGRGIAATFLYLGNRDHNSPIANKLVRQALNYAVDKDAIVRDILGGTTTTLKGQIIGSDCFGYNASLAAYPYDPAKAKQLLAQAGYPNGFTIDFDSNNEQFTKGQEVAENIVSQLGQVGVNVQLHMLEWNLYLGKLLTTLDSSPLSFGGWDYAPNMDANLPLQLFLTSSPDKFYSNPQVDDLFAQETAEFDRSKRQQILGNIMSVMYDDPPELFLYQEPLLYGVSPRVMGFVPTPDGKARLNGISLNP
jgi:peptide/nickel transport system substrate-binding protein